MDLAYSTRPADATLSPAGAANRSTPGRWMPAWLCGALALSLIALLYAALQNQFWVRYGDSELYLSIARNLVRGQGFRFGGQPVGIVPPGWPLVLAAAMKLTSRLILLKLIPLSCVLAFLVVSFAVLRRYTTPAIAAFCILITASLDPVFSLTYMFFSDPLFSLLAMAAVWAGLRLSDDDGRLWHGILVLVLCAAMMFVRWAGLPWFVVIAGAMLSGELWPRVNRRWIFATLAAVVTLACFVGIRQAVKVDPSRIDPRYDSFTATNYDLDNTEAVLSDQMSRIAGFGLWPGGLLWRPLAAFYPIRWVVNLAGWALAAAMLAMFFPMLRHKQWIWLGAVLYVAVLAINWPDPMPRYLVPVAPLLVLAVYAGVASAASIIPWRWSRTLALNVVFASILVVNGLAYLGEAFVMNQRRFYDHYEGGVHKQLIEAAWYLNHHAVAGPEIAISQRWANNERFTTTDGFRRAMCFLIDRPLVTVPEALCREPDAELLKWLVEHNVRYYLYQPAYSQRWHFASRSRNGIAIDQEETQWRLYEIVDGRALRVRLNPTLRWPTRVPGL